MEKKSGKVIRYIVLWILIAACMVAAIFFAWHYYNKDGMQGALLAAGKNVAAGKRNAAAGKNVAAGKGNAGALTGKTDLVSAGIRYIRDAENMDTAPIEDKLFIIDRAKLLKELEQDPNRVFETLKGYNTVIIGDSRAVGFSYYNYLDAAHVLSGVSWSIMQIPSVLPQVAAINPQVIIISFGINEIGPVDGRGYYYPTPEIYANATLDYVAQIRKLAPNAKIYFSGVLPVQDWVLQKSPRYGRIPDWNETMKPIFAQAGVGFIDVAELCANHQNLYIGDGIHFTGAFYPYWGAAILSTIMEDESLQQ